MTHQKLGLTDLIAAVQERIGGKTGIPCYDHVENNTPSPFYFAEIVRVTPANSKTMYRDNITVNIHCIAEPGESSVQIYQLIEKLQEAMTQDIVLLEPFELIMQTDGGVQTIKTDETNEKHAVVPYILMVWYGFKCKT